MCKITTNQCMYLPTETFFFSFLIYSQFNVWHRWTSILIRLKSNMTKNMINALTRISSRAIFMIFSSFQVNEWPLHTFEIIKINPIKKYYSYMVNEKRKKTTTTNRSDLKLFCPKLKREHKLDKSIACCPS